MATILKAPSVQKKTVRRLLSTFNIITIAIIDINFISIAINSITIVNIQHLAKNIITIAIIDINFNSITIQ